MLLNTEAEDRDNETRFSENIAGSLSGGTLFL